MYTKSINIKPREERTAISILHRKIMCQTDLKLMTSVPLEDEPL
jgi:hypothetical protein